MNYFSAFFDFLVKTLDKAQWGRFVFFLLIFVLLLNYSESRTNFLYFSSIEQKIAILERLNQLSETGIKDPVLKKIHQELSIALLETEVQQMETINLQLTALKFLSGSLLGIMFIIWAFAAKKRWDERQKAIKGAFSVAVVFGIIGLILPVVPINLTLSLVANSILLTLAQFALLILIGENKPNEPSNKNASAA